jgi:beta-galactosidase
MEECHQDYGYLLYRTHITGPSIDSDEGDTLTINELRDRAHIYLDGTYLETLERTAGRCVIQTQKRFQVPKEAVSLDILVENQGRCNFPPFSQDYKGITENVFLGDCFVLSNWEHYPIKFSKKQLENLEWSSIIAKDPICHSTRTTTNNRTNRPTFYKAQWDLSAYAAEPFLRDTYIHLPQFHKGVVIVNGFNLGRYWNIGPQLSLYCPAPFLVAGMNEIIIFDEEGVAVLEDGRGLEIEFIDHLVMKT